jgi:L-lactate dehydrogenase (cytochrome)
LYALASGGQPQVAALLDILAKELDVSMALTGVRDVTAVRSDILLSPEDRVTESDATSARRAHG